MLQTAAGAGISVHSRVYTASTPCNSRGGLCHLDRRSTSDWDFGQGLLFQEQCLEE